MKLVDQLVQICALASSRLTANMAASCYNTQTPFPASIMIHAGRTPRSFEMPVAESVPHLTSQALDLRGDSVWLQAFRKLPQ